MEKLKKYLIVSVVTLVVLLAGLGGYLMLQRTPLNQITQPGQPDQTTQPETVIEAKDLLALALTSYRDNESATEELQSLKGKTLRVGGFFAGAGVFYGDEGGFWVRIAATREDVVWATQAYGLISVEVKDSSLIDWVIKNYGTVVPYDPSQVREILVEGTFVDFQDRNIEMTVEKIEKI